VESVTIPAARLSPAAQMTASGVRSSCETPGDELDLPVGQTARALGGTHDQGGAGQEQCKNACAHREIAPAHRGDHRVDGAGAVPDEEAPVAGVATPAEGRHPPSAERRRPRAAARAVGHGHGRAARSDSVASSSRMPNSPTVASAEPSA
jgi:hypothetical protein